jgi:signal transduction histidine kinase
MRKRLAGLPLFDIAIGLVVGIFGIVRVLSLGSANVRLSLLIAIGMAVAAGLYRRAPLVGLGLVWLTALLQVIGGLDIAFVQLAAVIVAYGTSRYGKPVTVILSIISIPLGGIAAVLYTAYVGVNIVQETGLWQLLNLVMSATNLGFYDTPTGLLVGFIIVAALLAAPWGLGLLVRLREQSRRSAEERERAEGETARVQQVAELRTRQARLARDVHDVVGHSLAVIIAQADSQRALRRGGCHDGSRHE